MHDDGVFDERVAARYDESSAQMFAPAAVDPVVDLLAELAGDGRALERAGAAAGPARRPRRRSSRRARGALRRCRSGETARVFGLREGHWGIDEYDVAAQRLVSHRFETVEGRLERFSAPFRYAWPAELDLMAQLAGLRLRDRWSGWRREPFTAQSRGHVSVWERPAS